MNSYKNTITLVVFIFFATLCNASDTAYLFMNTTSQRVIVRKHYYKSLLTPSKLICEQNTINVFEPANTFTTEYAELLKQKKIKHKTNRQLEELILMYSNIFNATEAKQLQDSLLKVAKDIEVAFENKKDTIRKSWLYVFKYLYTQSEYYAIATNSLSNKLCYSLKDYYYTYKLPILIKLLQNKYIIIIDENQKQGDFFIGRHAWLVQKEGGM